MERRLSRHPEKFGTGVIEGVAGPESANNSAVAGAMIPLLSLGLPCNPVTALLMGALIIHGVQPGPMLITRHPEIYWGVIASFYVGNVMLLILNLPLIGIWVQFLRIPYRILFPLILLLCVVGTYSTNLNVFDIWVMIGFGLLGYLLRKRDYELAPFILALVLGPLFEQSLRQALILSAKDPMIFVNRPIALWLLVVSFLLLVFFIWGRWKEGKEETERLKDEGWISSPTKANDAALKIATPNLKSSLDHPPANMGRKRIRSPSFSLVSIPWGRLTWSFIRIVTSLERLWVWGSKRASEKWLNRAARRVRRPRRDSSSCSGSSRTTGPGWSQPSRSAIQNSSLTFDCGKSVLQSALTEEIFTPAILDNV